MTTTFALCFLSSIAQAQDGHDNPAQMLLFRTSSAPVYLPVVKARSYTTLCDALLFRDTGVPAFAQIDDASVTGCNAGGRAAQRVQMFGGFGQGCRHEPARRDNKFLSSMPLTGDGTDAETRTLRWADLFEPPRQDSALADPRFRAPYRMYDHRQQNVQTSYLLMRLPFASVGTNLEARRAVLRTARICEGRPNAELDPRLAALAHDKFLVFDPQAPARGSFLFDDLNTPVQLFFRESSAPETAAPLLQLNRKTRETGPVTWSNRLYKYQWSPQGDSLSGILVPEQPFWLRTLDTAGATPMAVTTRTPDDVGRVVLQYPQVLARNRAPRSDSDFAHRRIVLPFNNVSARRDLVTERVAQTLAGLTPQQGPSLRVETTDPVTFAAMANTALDASAADPSATEQRCIDDLSRMVVRATSPFVPFGDDVLYRLRMDGKKANMVTYVNGHCHRLDHLAADGAQPVNGPLGAPGWTTKATRPGMRHVAFSTDALRDVRLTSGETVTLPEVIWSSLEQTQVSHPGFDDGTATRHPARFVLVDDEAGKPFYIQDFSVSTLTALAYFRNGRQDFNRLVRELLGGNSFSGKCYLQFFDLALFAPGIDVSEEREKQLLWILTMHNLAEELANHAASDAWDFMAQEDDVACHKQKTLSFLEFTGGDVTGLDESVRIAFDAKPSDALQRWNEIRDRTNTATAQERQQLDIRQRFMRNIRNFARQLADEHEYPLMLVNHGQAEKLVQGVMGFPNDALGRSLGEVVFQDITWTLQPVSEDAMTLLIRDNWTIFDAYGNDTGRTTQSDSDPAVARFGDPGLNYVLAHRPHMGRAASERVVFGIHNLFAGPFLNVTDADGNSDPFGKQSLIDKARTDGTLDRFSARMMLVPTLED
ncbi:hypothetical protein [Leisingera sp. ANG-M1]|uniref:hypothetical protein n=1 Tax=Leisingera sp. ANG-M1 TaxID=1577895 RepID=UPI00126A37CC|nr:hypothetical protein [Leisingera sp. ANG-M1]